MQYVLASGGEDKLICVWKLDPRASLAGIPEENGSGGGGGSSSRAAGSSEPVPKRAKGGGASTSATATAAAAATALATTPSEIIFQHLGHKRGVSLCECGCGCVYLTGSVIEPTSDLSPVLHAPWETSHGCVQVPNTHGSIID